MQVSLLVSLAEVKAHLRWPNPTEPNDDDTNLASFIEAADEVIRFECDEILPRQFQEQHDGGKYKIYLYHRPILEVLNIQENWGYISYELDFQQVGALPETTSMFGYSIDNAVAGEISRRSVASVPIPFIPGDENILVEYIAGMSKVPANIKLAAKELVAHWWRNSQQRPGGAGAGIPAEVAFDSVVGANYSRDTESGNQNINIGVPNRILELIKGSRHMPIMS